MINKSVIRYKGKNWKRIHFVKTEKIAVTKSLWYFKMINGLWLHQCCFITDALCEDKTNQRPQRTSSINKNISEKNHNRDWFKFKMKEKMLHVMFAPKHSFRAESNFIRLHWRFLAKTKENTIRPLFFH